MRTVIQTRGAFLEASVTNIVDTREVVNLVENTVTRNVNSPGSNRPAGITTDGVVTFVKGMT